MTMPRLRTAIVLLWIMVTTVGGAMADDAPVKTVCFGRYLFEVPVEFDRIETSTSVRGASFADLGPGDKRALDRMLRERTSALTDGQRPGVEGEHVYMGTENINDMPVLRSAVDTSVLGVQNFDLWTEETLVLRDGRIFSVEMFMEEQSLERDRQEFAALTGAIRPREPGEIPAGEGLCAGEGVYIDLPPGADNYGGTLYADEIGQLELFFNERGPEDPPLSDDQSFSVPGQSIDIADMRGEAVRFVNNGYFEFGAIVGNLDDQHRDGTQMTARMHIFDGNRLPQGYTEADKVWESILRSMRRKR